MTYIVNSARLRGRRAELGLSQVGLAKIAGVSPNTVTHLEKDPNINVTLAVLSRLCSALDLSITEIMTKAEPKKGG